VAARGAQVADGLLEVVELLRLPGELRRHGVVGHPAPAVVAAPADACRRGPDLAGDRGGSRPVVSGQQGEQSRPGAGGEQQRAAA
jgi:hypothetical protein